MPTGYPRVPEPREWVLTKACSKCEERKPWALFGVGRRNEDGSIKSPKAWCLECSAAATTLETRARYRERNRQHIRTYHNKWQKDRRKQRRREDAHHTMLVPARPFQEWLARYIDDGGELNNLSRVCGVQDRSFRRILYEGQANVSLILVDKVLTSQGEHINSLYEGVA